MPSSAMQARPERGRTEFQEAEAAPGRPAFNRAVAPPVERRVGCAALPAGRGSGKGSGVPELSLMEEIGGDWHTALVLGAAWSLIDDSDDLGAILAFARTALVQLAAEPYHRRHAGHVRGSVQAVRNARPSRANGRHAGSTAPCTPGTASKIRSLRRWSARPESRDESRVA